MRFVLKRLSLGIILIVLASTVLLLCDLGRRTVAARTTAAPRTLAACFDAAAR